MKKVILISKKPKEVAVTKNVSVKQADGTYKRQDVTEDKAMKLYDFVDCMDEIRVQTTLIPYYYVGETEDGKHAILCKDKD